MEFFASKPGDRVKTLELTFLQLEFKGKAYKKF